MGLIVPSINTTTEPDFSWAAPTGMSFHAARVLFRENTIADLDAMNAQVGDATRLLAGFSPDVVAYACTSGSFFAGTRAAGLLADSIRAIVSCPVVTTSGAMVDAMSSLGVRRVALATPYRDDITAIEADFLKSSGFDVVSTLGLGLAGPAVNATSQEAIIDLATAADCDAAEGVFISCTDLRAMEAIGHIEDGIGKPVFSSNQVTLWGVLRALGLREPVAGFGRLLEQP